MDLRLY